MRIRGTTLLVTGLALAVAASACSAPNPDAFNQPITPNGGSGEAKGDPAGGDPSGDSSGDPSADTASAQTKTNTTSSPKACIPSVKSSGTGEHHPGESCAQCHDTMANAHWTVSGTVFASGGVGVAGATIELIDASGKSLKLVTADNGNFYTTTVVKMPLTVRSSKCPSDSAMSSKVTEGSCNSCHGSSNPITL